MRAGIKGKTVHLVVYEVFSILTHLVPKAIHCRWLRGSGVKKQEGTRRSVYVAVRFYSHNVFCPRSKTQVDFFYFPSLLIFTCFGSNSLSVGAMYCTAGKLTSPLAIDVNGGRVAAVVCAHCVVSHLSRDFTLRRFISQMNKQFNKQVSSPSS